VIRRRLQKNKNEKKSMTDFRGNIDHWLKQSEPDYFMFFLKAWIPFNAWYVAELPQLGKKDTKIIKELQDNANSKPRIIIETYLTTNKPDSIKFKSHLAELHHYLELKTVKHNGLKLSFTNLSLTENPKKFEKDTDNEGNVYKAEVKPGIYEVLILDKSSNKIMHFKQQIFNIEELIKYTDYIKIQNKKIQKRILKCYEAIDPKKPISLVSNSKTKTDFISLSSENKINFINDPTTIAKGCIKVLYALRCMLFHGEIEPTNANKPVYEHSYYLLRLIIKDIN
jgi:hypothetical protein